MDPNDLIQVRRFSKAMFDFLHKTIKEGNTVLSWEDWKRIVEPWIRNKLLEVEKGVK